MMPPEKDQTNIDYDNPKLDASDGVLVQLIDSTYENKDMARQEYAQEADINYMLSRLGVAPARLNPFFGEWDDSIDLQTAIAATRQAQTAFDKLPPELKGKFRSMEDLLTAIETAQIEIKETPEPTPAPEPPNA